jgi:hypothetical protein
MGSWLDLLELLPVSLAAEALPGAAISLQESDDATLAAPLRGEGAAEAAPLAQVCCQISCCRRTFGTHHAAKMRAKSVLPNGRS